MKYLDKVKMFPDSIYIITGINYSVCGNTFEDALERYKLLGPNNGIMDKYDNINVQIINKSVDPDISLDSSNIDISKIYHRNLVIAGDLSEVYFEWFIINGKDYIYDYNILYGDFKASKNDIFISEYYSDKYGDDKEYTELNGLCFILNVDIDDLDTNYKTIIGSVINDNGDPIYNYGTSYKRIIPSSCLTKEGSTDEIHRKGTTIRKLTFYNRES